MSKISGQTNVKNLRMGRGCLKGIGTDLGMFIVVTMEVPWMITKDLLGKNPVKVIIVESVEATWLDNQLAQIPPCDVVVGIGGGQAVDAAKYFSWKKNIRLVTVPTILSVDAFVTPAAGVRQDHQVIYVGESMPDPLVVDFDVIRSAPPELNIAGIGDLLSMHTATFDWEYAQREGKSEYPFSSSDIQRARKLLNDLYKVLPDIRKNSDKGLMALIEGYMQLNTICLPAGHYRVEEGSEHYLFYELEERLRRPFIHGYIVGMGIYLMSQLQNNDFEGIRQVMEEVGLQYHPANMNIGLSTLVKSLMNLKNFVKSKPDLWYTVIDDSEITKDWVSMAISELRF